MTRLHANGPAKLTSPNGRVATSAQTDRVVAEPVSAHAAAPNGPAIMAGTGGRSDGAQFASEKKHLVPGTIKGRHGIGHEVDQGADEGNGSGDAGQLTDVQPQPADAGPTTQAERSGAPTTSEGGSASSSDSSGPAAAGSSSEPLLPYSPVTSPHGKGGHILPYALGGLAVIGGGAAVAAGGGGGGATSTPKTPVAVDTPVLSLVADTGSSSTDGITNRGTIAVSSLQASARWEYSLDSGATWTAGTGSSFILPQGRYASGSVQARQTDAAGTVSTPGRLALALTVDTASVTPTINAISGDNVLTPAEATSPSGVTVTGTAEANATVSVAWRTPGNATQATTTVQADAVGRWSTTFQGAAIPDATVLQETTVVVSATDTAGNASDIARLTVTTDPGVTVTGKITASWLSSVSKDLTVSLYSGTGKLLAKGLSVAADGSFSATKLAVGRGEVIIAATSVSSSGSLPAGAAQSAPSAFTGLLSAVVIGDPKVTLNLNPVTSVAAYKLGLTNSGLGDVPGTTNPADVVNVNLAVAKVLGLGTASLPVLTPEAAGIGGIDSTVVLSPAQQLGVLLAAMAGIDGGLATSRESITALLNALTVQGDIATLGDGGILSLVEGANTASQQLGLGLVGQVSHQIATGSTAAHGVTIAPLTGDDILTRAEIGSAVLTGAVGPGAAAVVLQVGTRTVEAQISGTGWSYALTADDLAAVGTGTALVIHAEARFSDGTRTSAARGVLIETGAPAAPVIAPVSDDDLVGRTERNGGLTINGQAAAGTTVEVAVEGGPAHRVVADATGRWTATIPSTELPGADQDVAFTARVTDRFGNVGDLTRHLVRFDLTAPAVPVINPVNGVDLVGPASAAQGVAVSGTGEPGGQVTVGWSGGSTRTASINGQGSWSITFSAEELPPDGLQTLTSFATDVAGNQGATATRSVLLAKSNSSSVLAQIAGGDGINLAEASEGVPISGIAPPGSTLLLNWDGAAPKTVKVDSRGVWQVTYSFADVPADGTRRLTVTGTDAAGGSLAPISRDILIDTQPPLAATIDRIAGDDVVNAAEKSSGVTIGGHGEAGTTVLVGWGERSHSETVGTDGTWRVVFSAAEIPSDVAASNVTARLTDALGNASQTATRTVAIATALPPVPRLALLADTGANGSDGYSADGRVVVSGLVNGAAWEFSSDGGASWLSGNRFGRTFAGGAVGFALIDGAYDPGAIRARQVDPNGNPSAEGAITLPVTIKSIAPTILLDPVTEDDRINAAEKAAGVTVSGQIGNPVDGIAVQVRVAWQKVDRTIVTRVADVTADGVWSVAFSPEDLAGSDGRTSLTVTATDSVGNSATSPARAIEFKTGTPPAPVLALRADTGISTTDGITNDPLILLSGITGRQQWEYSLDGGLTWQSGGVGNGTLRLDDRTYAAGQISVRQIDDVGNVGTSAVIGRAITIDTQIAEPTIDPIGANGVINAALAQAGLSITGTAEVGATVQLTWHGQTYTALAVARPGTTTGAWTIRLGRADIPADGTWPVEVVATDVAGNRSTAGVVTSDVIVDTRLPAAPVIAAVAGNDVVSAAERDAGVTITGRAEAGTLVQVGFGSLSKQTIASAAGAWVVTFGASEVPADSARIAVTATSSNARGNVSPGAQRLVEIDTTTPDPVITAVNGNDLVNGAQKAAGVLVSGTAEAGAIVVLTLGQSAGSTSGQAGTAPASSVTATADATGAWQARFATWQLPADGTATLTASAIDPKGNVSGAVVRTLIFDTVAPAASTIAAIGGDNIITAAEAASRLIVSGQAEPGARIALVWDGVEVSATAAADGSWSAPITVTPGNAPRDIRAAVTVTDSAGNVSPTASRTVLVQGAGPASAAIAPVAVDDRINIEERRAGVRVTGLAPGGGQLDLYVNGQKWGQVSASANGQWTQSFSEAQLPANGAWDLSLRSGDTVLYSRQVVIDTSAPDAPVVTGVGGANATVANGGNDLILSAAEKGSGLVRITGTSEAGAEIQLQWGNVTKVVTAGSDGSWSAGFLPGELPADGTTTVFATATDVAGNVGRTASIAVTVATGQTGTAGADTLVGVGAGDVLAGGAGNDLLIVPDLTFRSVIGGDGTDVLSLGPNIRGATLDLAHLPVSQRLEVEVVDLTGGGGNHLVVDAAAILADTGGANRLIVTGTADEQVTALGFARSGTTTADGHNYTIYTSGPATLWVDQTIQHVVI